MEASTGRAWLSLPSAFLRAATKRAIPARISLEDRLPQRHKDALPEETLYAPIEWTGAGEYEDIRYETGDGIAKVTIDRPEVLNAFRPQTLIEISAALELAREDTGIGAIVLTGEGDRAFCSGGDQQVRGDTGYVAEGASLGRFHVTDLQVQMRRLPKPVVAMVAGYAIGGGHILHICCDLTIAADNARFGQTGPPGRVVGRRLRRLAPARSRRHEEGKGALAAVPPVRRGGGAGDGPCQRRGPSRPARAGDGRLVPRDARPLPLRPAPGQGELQRPRGRLRRDPAARPRRQPPLLRDRGGAQEGREAFKEKRAPDFSRVPEAAR